MKNVKTKFITSFVMFIILMTTLVSYKVYATPEIEDIIINNSSNKLEIGTKVNKDFTNLRDEWFTVCNDHGAPLKVSDPVPTTGHAHNTTYYSIPTYKVKENVICNPRQAYILNYSKDNGEEYASYVQTAWWKTKANKGTIPSAEDKNISISAFAKGTRLDNVAKSYQNFVKKIVAKGVDVENTGAYKTLTNNGNTIQFPEVDVKSKFKFDTSKVKVNFSETDQKYIIGPFYLQYPQKSNDDAEFGGDFGKITGFDIYTNANNGAKLSNSQWTFMDKNGNKFTNYPKSSKTKPFYVVMDYIEGATTITGIDIDYKYLVAGAEYQHLEGNYTETKYTCASELNEDKEEVWTCSSEDIEHKAQALGLIVKAARWYETEKISFKVNQATLQIKKQVLDENGNELTEAQIKEKYGEQLLAFTVKVTHRGETRRITKKVLAGSTATIGTFMWDDDEAAPTYEVEEVKPLNATWEDVSISNNRKGTLQNGQTVVVTATNKLKPKSNKMLEKRAGIF